MALEGADTNTSDNEPLETRIVDQVVYGQGHLSRWKAKNGFFVYSQGTSGEKSRLSGSENMDINQIEKLAEETASGSLNPKKIESQQKLETIFEREKAKLEV